MHGLVLTTHVFASGSLQVATHRATTSFPWYVVRAAGFVAAGLLILLMLSGIGQVTGLTYRFIEPVKAWALHKAMAIALCVSIAIHVGFLLLDHYLPFSLGQVLVPLNSSYSNGTKMLGIPLGGLAVAFGILAMYGVAIIVASSLGWINTRRARWHKLHYLSYLVMFLVILHGLYAGTDLKYGTFREVWIGLAAIVVLGIISRLLRAGATAPRNDK